MNDKLLFPTEKLIEQLGIDWNKDILSEKKFFKSNKNRVGYLGFPWDSISSYTQLCKVENEIKKYIKHDEKYYTCCQCKDYKKFIHLFEKLNINTVYICYDIPDIFTIQESCDIHFRKYPLFTVKKNIYEESQEKKQLQTETNYTISDKTEKNKKVIYSENDINAEEQFLTGKPFPTEHLIQELGIDWETPVITEKKFYEQRKYDTNFMGFPWATVIRLNIYNNVKEKFIQYVDKNKKYYTCCQSIHYKKLIDLFKHLNIICIYASHKTKDLNVIEDIVIKPCPLYAISIEDETRNSIFKEKNLLYNQRKYLYNFVGGYMHFYISDIREKIFKLKRSDDTIIINTGDWHFNPIVYRNKPENFERALKYNEILLNSRYTLCPSGAGSNIIRLWEALGAGSIPILIDSNLDLPENELWNNSIINIREQDIYNLHEILNNISYKEEQYRKYNCLQIYNQLKNNYTNYDYIKNKELRTNKININFVNNLLYIYSHSVLRNKENFYQKHDSDNIYLVTQFYIDNNKNRHDEIMFALKKNIHTSIFTKIIQLNERIYSREEMNLSHEEYEKITQIVIGRRLQYDDISLLKKYDFQGYIVMCNSDIFFDESIKNIFTGSLYKIKSWYFLTRYEYTGENDLQDCKLYTNIRSSHDTFICHSKWISEDVNFDNILLGIPGCENTVKFILDSLGYNIFNPCNTIRTYHYHRSHIRNWRNENKKYKGPYLYIYN
jgi:hypothetical protein